MTTPEPEALEGNVTAGPGGAMTAEVGVITGDLTIRTHRQAGGLVDVTVQHTGADEWYTLIGSPTAAPDGALTGFHTTVLAAAARGGGAEVPR
ncbi:hypothetical protein [Streptomyces gardneri]|uniref:Uncharacterized protein n=1 Tax=Streptomyces gardneri TaxID=66892 RepID=A0A4Y3RQ84_9ACTN|nr:hypothetical protein [Streptomyces gardneri]GEB60061.1 hypothetical protein SGA01_56660 [Streptomyces gardneri]GHH21071.1 hypothetical protein GCM10017674_75450 [Streptomyces gardneri]